MTKIRIDNYRIPLKKVHLKNIQKILKNEPFKVPIVVKEDCYENQCHSNVERYIKKYGGERIIGYYILLNDDDINEVIAIRHSIVKHNNKFIDITPFSDNRKYNIFIPNTELDCKHICLYN